jgi:hypothetical protein
VLNSRVSFALVLGAVAIGVSPALPASPIAVSAQSDVRLLRVPDAGIQPQVVSDGDVVHLVYFTGEAARGDLFYVRRRGAEAWSAPIRVNAPGTAIATGTVRGATVAAGRNGRLHAAWMGSDRAPDGPGGQRPMLYTRMNDAGTAFEPERNVLQFAVGLDGGGAVAADREGRVYVAWHAGGPGVTDEGQRRVWLARSTDDGRTFAREQAVDPAGTGACGCCGMRAAVDRAGAVQLFYRSATALVHRDAHLLVSSDHGASFGDRTLDEWTIAACPMSTFALAPSADGTIAAWETAGEIKMRRIGGAPDAPPVVMAPPPRAGQTPNRRHPALAVRANGDVLLAWSEGTAWQRGGFVAWQVFSRSGQATLVSGRMDGVPVWSMPAAFARPDGTFTIIY